MLFAALSWYLLVFLLGWLAFPLAFHLFSGLPSRGYALARVLGLLIWAWVFWLLASLGLAYNDWGGILAALLVLAGLSWLAWRKHKDDMRRFWQASEGVRRNSEWVFALAFLFLLGVRVAVPEAVGTEKPMELAFINAILRSPTAPPHDPWLAGYAISYYYFGYWMTAMLARLTAVGGGVAFNLMLALVFALAAQASYGLLYDLLQPKEGERAQARAWLGPLFLLFMGNLEGLLEVLHRRGLFWATEGFNFWRWLDIKDLSQPPAQPAAWLPDRFWFWWRASRVVQDYDLTGRFLEVIDEFPAFSFVLGDLHPHVLAIPFFLLAVGFSLHLYSRQDLPCWQPRPFAAMGINVDGFYLRPEELFFMALLLGGLAFLNTWDILAAGVLVGGAYLLGVVQRQGWTEALWGQALMLALPLVALAFLLYLPFYLGFSSQAGGVLPNLITPVRGAHLWVMFAPLFLPLFFWLGVRWRAGDVTAVERRQALWWTLGVTALLALAALLLTLALSLDADLTRNLLILQGFAPDDLGGFLQAALAKRLAYAGGLATLLFLGWLAAGRLLALPRRSGANGFVAGLIVLGTVLVLVPEFIYLRDQFGTRMNTVFKFYYQAWLLWSLAAAYAVATLGQKKGWRPVLALVMLSGLVYPALAYPARTNNFRFSAPWTLDASAFLAHENPDEGAALTWLQQAPLGVVAEAVGGSYSRYARVSMATGLPTVLGWPGHEIQWRGDAAYQGTRLDDVRLLYESEDWQTATEIIQRYNIRYVYVGPLERATYTVREAKFRRFARPYSFGSVVIYEVWP